MSKNQMNLQDAFLNSLRRENVGVVLYLLDGTQLRGTIKGFDRYSLLLEIGSKLQLVYKHALAGILPVKHVGALLSGSNADERSARQSPDSSAQPREDSC